MTANRRMPLQDEARRSDTPRSMGTGERSNFDLLLSRSVNYLTDRLATAEVARIPNDDRRL